MQNIDEAPQTCLFLHFLFHHQIFSSSSSSSSSPTIMIFLIWIVLSSPNYLAAHGSSIPWNPNQYIHHATKHFEQKTDRFWQFNQQTNRWIELQLPHHLVSCAGGSCRKVELIDRGAESRVAGETSDGGESTPILPQRKRISLTRMSETSVWITGQSGAIYERYWNGVQWVVAPHDLPITAGPAVSVFTVNQTILALSEAGLLYQMQITEDSQPIWVEFPLTVGADIRVKSGAVSEDGQKIYFCTKSKTLIELCDVERPRWVNHGLPPGANVAEIANVRSYVIFTISSKGDLYEFDRSSRPSWKKHISKEGPDISLSISKGCSFNGESYVSLFLLTKGGELIERRVDQKRWKWIIHGSSKGHNLTSITMVRHDDANEKHSLFFTTITGNILEYRLPTLSDSPMNEAWINHMHPLHSKAARGVTGVQLQYGRTIFAMDDGRLAELHLPGTGGETSGPGPLSHRRKPPTKYVWSILDAPETEGWNAEYCSDERGPTNCIAGVKDETFDSASPPVTRRRKTTQTQQQEQYISISQRASPENNAGAEEARLSDDLVKANFRLRVMYEGRSFFMVTDGGLTFEYLYGENVWFWLRHEHSTAVKAAVGNYNGSLMVVDEYGSLFMRERSSGGLKWINCTAMRKGRQVVSGPPWDRVPGKDTMMFTADDSVFFVGKTGRLLQFTVSFRKFKWKDCKTPPNTKISSIVDQEQFRRNIIFVVGRNGRLYQYNKVTHLWHEHYQSKHLLLSGFSGTAMRASPLSLAGSIFMISRDGGLVEYEWNAAEGWNWVEHGTPHKGVSLVGSPGPCFEGKQLFLIGSDGMVYTRYTEHIMWKWNNLGYPFMDEICSTEEFGKNGDCDMKVASTRPIPFSKESMIFELRDGRLAELKQTEEAQWVWSRTIGTPTSLCQSNYWTAYAT